MRFEGCLVLNPITIYCYGFSLTVGQASELPINLIVGSVRDVCYWAQVEVFISFDCL